MPNFKLTGGSFKIISTAEKLVIFIIARTGRFVDKGPPVLST